jgi:hypothetical protein
VSPSQGNITTKAADHDERGRVTFVSQILQNELGLSAGPAYKWCDDAVVVPIGREQLLSRQQCFDDLPRHHSNNGKLLLVELNRPASDGRIRVEIAAPRVAERSTTFGAPDQNPSG